MLIVFLFNSLYYNQWHSLIAISLYQIVSQAIQAALFEKSKGECFVAFVENYAWLILILLPCHMLLTYAGFKYAEVDFKSVDNEKLLDELEEGILIVNRKRELLYQNQAVEKCVEINLQSETSALDCYHRYVKCEAVFTSE